MPNLLLDGEINYPGKTSQYCTHVTGSDPSTAIAFQNDKGPIHYTIFDMLRTPKGTWLMKTPYSERRKLLEYFYTHYVKGSLMEPYIHLTQCILENKAAFKDRILDEGGEGVVIKKLNSPYIMGKKPKWIWMKIKQEDEADLIITGFDPPTKEYTGSSFDSWPYWKDEGGIQIPVSKHYYYGWIGAIQLSAYVNGVLTKICTSAGMDEEIRKDMTENGNLYLGRVAQIGYMEKTEAGYPRHPKFIALHPDKEAKECTWELTL
jgi:ATP-dependent DNA ligase